MGIRYWCVKIYYSQQIYKKEFNDEPLIKTVILSGYSGERIVSLGEINVEVSYGNSRQNFKLLVVDTANPVLISHDWINKLKLLVQIKSIFKVSDAIESLIPEFPEVCSSSLWRYREPEVKLELIKNAKPVFL